MQQRQANSSKNDKRIADDIQKLKNAGITNSASHFVCKKEGMADAFIKFKMMEMDHEPWIAVLAKSKDPAATAVALIELSLNNLEKDPNNIRAVVRANRPVVIALELIELQKRSILNDTTRHLLSYKEQMENPPYLNSRLLSVDLDILSKAELLEYGICVVALRQKDPEIADKIKLLKNKRLLDKVAPEDFYFAPFFAVLSNFDSFSPETYREIKNYQPKNPANYVEELAEFATAMGILNQNHCYKICLPFLKQITSANYETMAAPMALLANTSGNLSKEDADFLLSRDKVIYHPDRTFVQKENVAYYYASALRKLREFSLSDSQSRELVKLISDGIDPICNFDKALSDLSKANLEIDIEDLIAKINAGFTIRSIKDTTVIFEKPKGFFYSSAEVGMITVHYPKVDAREEFVKIKGAGLEFNC